MRRDRAKLICFTYVCQRCGCPTVEIQEYDKLPQENVGAPHSLFMSVPYRKELAEDKQLEAAYNEVFYCFSCEAYKAGVIMARGFMDSIINKLIKDDRLRIGFDERKKDKGLKEKIGIAKKKHLISSQQLEVARL